MAQLLIIEDDPETVGLLSRGLREAGHAVEAVGDGEQGLDCLKRKPFDMVILDVMMPRMDGWGLLGALRSAGSDVPVLMVTALDDVDHRARGLSLGADDYVTKPFSLEELSLRVGVICRRLNKPLPGGAQVSELLLDEERLCAVREGAEIPLTAREFALLKLLLEFQGTTLSRQFIAQQVWDMHVDSESNVVEANIRRLRQKIDGPFSKKLIQTMGGRGYVLR